MLQKSQVFQEADDDDLGSRFASGLVANPVVGFPTNEGVDLRIYLL